MEKTILKYNDAKQLLINDGYKVINDDDEYLLAAKNVTSDLIRIARYSVEGNPEIIYTELFKEEMDMIREQF